MSLDFKPFGKIPRYSHRKVTITEKIDGTNAQIFFIEPQDVPEQGLPFHHVYSDNGLVMLVGSRKRYIAPVAVTEDKDSDNYGFAAWAWDNVNELAKLGPGRHYGEWY